MFSPYSKTNQTGKKKRIKRGGLTPKTFHAKCEDKEIYYCEVCKYEHDNNVKRKNSRKGGLSIIDPAHRHERNDYKHGNEHILWHFNQVIRAHRQCHDFIDDNHDYREQVFLKLRGKDLLE